jgi:hypothetical protein
MTIDFRMFAIAMAVLLVSAPIAAHTQNPPDRKVASKNQRVERAKQRCGLNHGVDCETAKGLKEWLLLERSRAEAVREGSRHLLPAQSSPAPSRR